MLEFKYGRTGLDPDPSNKVHGNQNGDRIRTTSVKKPA